ncbi:MAG: tRNA lysidine(34) synthetase TilS [Chthoniobacterales bacterium]|nr:tRNA lysidine(34) synthetase TilS [Chthoniobacterales bacterium]
MPSIDLTSSLALLDPEETLLLGISGGSDSVALLHLLLEHGYHWLVLCHFDHQLRGAASQEDARFVEELAASLHLPCELGQENVALRAQRDRLSLETAAREARYTFFAEVAKKKKCSRLLLAHHSDDQIETCLFHYLRGSGAAGLSGMQPLSHRMIGGVELTLIRPLLAISKKQLKNYLEKRALPFREDSSNESLVPMRNRLRHQLLPLLDIIFGTTYRQAILRTATILSAEQEYLESLAAPFAAELTLNVHKLNTHPLALRRRIIHRWLRNHHFSEVGFHEVELIHSLLAPNAPKKINLPQNRHASVRGGEIYLY